MRRGTVAACLFALVVLASALPAWARPERPPPLRAVNVLVAAPGAVAAPAARGVAWCGAGQPPAIDRQPSVDLTSPRQVHAVYVLPADGAGDYASFASRIATDLAAIGAWWQRQDASRTPRFDRFPFPGCTTPFADLDVGFLRLPHEGAYYADGDGSRLLADLGALRALSSYKLLIYYDGPPIFDPQVCGTAFVPSEAVTRLGGDFGLAFVWTQSACGADIGTGRLAAAVAAHELIHSLGALVQPGAPNACPSPDEGHVCDSEADILFPTASATTTLDGQILDVNRDDYYAHDGPWFDVQDSPWLTHLPQLMLSIRVQARGGAGGAVRMREPGTLVCPASCSLALDTGTRATLVAVPSSGSRFVGWSGVCAGRRSCVVSLDAPTAVTAVFGPATFRLTVVVTGKGAVRSAPHGLSCPGRCSASFRADGAVRLLAKPAAGQRFAGWSGACSGRGACVVTLDRDRAVRARFTRR